jgi:hypothetical protein
MSLELPIGFEDSPEPVKLDVLQNRKSSQLTDAIREELGNEATGRQGLQKHEKAQILLRLRLGNKAINESGE